MAERQDALDGLRAVAIAGVMGFHYIPHIVTGGSLAVDIFFVMSGWLITGSLLRETEREGRVAYARFEARRFLRLTPPLAALIVAYVVLAPWLLPRSAPGRWIDAAWAATYLQNIRESFWPRPSPLSHTWFLALQAQFYLLWPPVLAWLLKLGRTRAAVLLLGAWAALTAARFIWFFTLDGPAPYYFTPLHAPGLLLGAAYALRPVTVRNWVGWIAFALLLGLLAFAQTKRYFLPGEPIAEWVAIAVIAAPPALLGFAPLAFLGRISYGIYLWHVPFMWVFRPTTWPVRIGLALTSIAAGWLTWLLLERPFERRPKTAAPATA